MNNDDFRVSVVSRVLTLWNAKEVCYAVAHGLEGYPDKVGRDVDIVAVKSGQPSMIECVEEIVAQDDRLTSYRPNEFFGMRIIVYNKFNQMESVEVHLIESLRWLGFKLLPDEIDLRSRLGYKYSQMVQYAKRAISPSLSNDGKRLDDRPSEFLIKEDEGESVEALLTTLLPEDQVSYVVVASERKDAKSVFDALSGSRIHIVKKHFKRNPVSAVTSICSAFLRKVTVALYPCAPIILIGKSVEGEIDDVIKKTIFVGLRKRSIDSNNSLLLRMKIISTRLFFLPQDRVFRARQGVVAYVVKDTATLNGMGKSIFDGCYDDIGDLKSSIMSITARKYGK